MCLLAARSVLAIFTLIVKVLVRLVEDADLIVIYFSAFDCKLGYSGVSMVLLHFNALFVELLVL